MKKQFLIKNHHIIANIHGFLSQNYQGVLDSGEVLEVNICLHKSKRNLEQNKRLHAMLQEIANQVWINGKQFSMETWKEHFKQMFLGVIELPNSRLMANPTHKLNTKECAEFKQKVEAYAVSELGVIFGGDYD